MDCSWAGSYVDRREWRKYVCRASCATKTFMVRSSSPLASSFWTMIGHTSPGDTNSGTTWWLLARWRLSKHSPNGLGFPPVCWELQYMDLWIQHGEAAEVVSLAGWMGKQGAGPVFGAEEPLQGYVSMTATSSPSSRREDCSPQWFSTGRAGSSATAGDSLSPVPSFHCFFWLT